MKVTFEGILKVSCEDIEHSFYIELSNGEKFRITQTFMGAVNEDFESAELANGCIIELHEITAGSGLDFSALLSAFDGCFENSEIYEETSYVSCIQVHKTAAFDDYDSYDNTLEQTAAIMRYLRDYEQKVA